MKRNQKGNSTYKDFVKSMRRKNSFPSFNHDSNFPKSDMDDKVEKENKENTIYASEGSSNLEQSQKIKRQKKIDRLDRIKKLWKGLESNTLVNEKLLSENPNKFITKFRKLYYSPKQMRFRDWLIEFEELIEELD